MVLVQKSSLFQLFLCNIGQEKFIYDILKRKKGLSRLKKQDIKKSRKLPIYPKALTHGFGAKITIFQTFFLGNIGQENVFYDILKRKHAFLGYKKKTSSKSRKIHMFPKEWTHGFGPKMAIFKTFFVRQYRPGKCLLRYSKTKKFLSRLQKQEVQKVDKLTFFPTG